MHRIHDAILVVIDDDKPLVQAFKDWQGDRDIHPIKALPSAARFRAFFHSHHRGDVETFFSQYGALSRSPNRPPTVAAPYQRHS